MVTQRAQKARCKDDSVADWQDLVFNFMPAQCLAVWACTSKFELARVGQRVYEILHKSELTSYQRKTLSHFDRPCPVLLNAVLKKVCILSTVVSPCTP